MTTPSYTVFQTETGGYVSTSYASTIPATSGYAFFVGKGVQYRLDGFLASGQVYISRSGISNLPPGKYEMLPQVIDATNRIYFLDTADVEVEKVLGTSQTAFTSGDTLLARLEALETASGTSGGVSSFLALTDTPNSYTGYNGYVVSVSGSQLIFASGVSGGVTDHGLLTGLGDNDHPQYFLASQFTASGDALYARLAAANTFTNTNTFAPDSDAVALTIEAFDGGAFPQSVLLDDFNRANGNTLGANWTPDLLQFGEPSPHISNSTLIAANNSEYAAAWWSGGGFGPDLDVVVTFRYLGSLTTTLYAALYVRMADPSDANGTGYAIALADRSAVGVGANLNVATLPNYGQLHNSVLAFNPVDGDRLGVRLLGSNLQVFIEHGGTWQKYAEVTGLTVTSGGYVGIEIQDTHPSPKLALDNFSATTLSPQTENLLEVTDAAGTTIPIVAADGTLPALTTHEDAADPHPQYQTQAEGDARYWPLTTDLATQAELDSHANATTSVHGIANTAALLTNSAIGSTVQAYDSTLAALANYNTNGVLVQTAVDTFAGRTITGTSNRLTVTNGDGVSGNPTLDISSSYIGQSTITTLGTIGTGVWQGSIIGATYGGTGVNNGSNTLTLGGVTSITGGGTIALAGFTVTAPASLTIAGLGIANIFTLAQTVQRDGIGTTSTDALVLANTTAAAAGAQQYSPRLRLTGQGWKTNATAASQTVDWAIEAQPAQGAANPSSNLAFLSQINGGGYSTLLSLSTTNAANSSGVTLIPNSNFNIQTANSVRIINAIGSTYQFQINGQTGITTMGNTGALQFTVGNAGSAVDVGISRSAANILEINNGTAGRWAALKAGAYDTNTASTVDVLTLGHRISSGTPSTHGVAMLFNLDSDTTADQNAARIAAGWSTATHASRTSYLAAYTVNNAGSLAARMQLDAGNGADSTGLLLWDVNSGALKRVEVGAADTGGTGYRVLRIAN